MSFIDFLRNVVVFVLSIFFGIIILGGALIILAEIMIPILIERWLQ